MPIGSVRNFGTVDNPDGLTAPGGTTNQVWTKASDDDFDSIWADAGAGSGDVTKDELAGAGLITSILDTDHIPVSRAGTPNTIKKVVWTAFKTILDGIYALTGHNHDSAYTAKNTAITGATKTKITYDTKGLVTSGDDATQDDIGDGATYKQYSSTEKSKLAGIEASADVTDLTNVSSSINGASAATPVDADKFPFVDDTDSTIKTVTGANLKTFIGAASLDIHGLTGESSLAAADEVPFYDDSASANRKVTYTNLVSNLGTSFDIKGGSSGQYLKKDGAGDYAFAWGSPLAPTFTNLTGDTTISSFSGYDMYRLEAASAITITINNPGVSEDGKIMILWRKARDTSQHIYSFASGVDGLGSSYDRLTLSSTALMGGLMMLVAYNQTWSVVLAPAGTWS